MYVRLCLLTMLAATDSLAGALDAAQDAYADLNYEGCRSSATEALGEPGDRAQRVEAFKLKGLCAAALGDTEQARESFVKMLAIDADARLPEGLSPRFTSSYLEAKGHWVGRNPLQLELFGEKLEGSTRVIRLIVHDDAELIANVAWEDDEGERSPPLMKAERMELEVPAEVEVTLLAIDRGGGIVAQLPLGKAGVDEPEPGDDDEPDPATVGEAEEQDGPPWLLIGVAAGAGVLVVAGAGAAVAGLLLSQPTSVDLRSGVVFGNQ
jgi:hypothetical protein